MKGGERRDGLQSPTRIQTGKIVALRAQRETKKKTSWLFVKIHGFIVRHLLNSSHFEYFFRAACLQVFIRVLASCRPCRQIGEENLKGKKKSSSKNIDLNIIS